MRKVIFTINDLEWMRKYYKLTEEQFAKMFKSQESFKCIYILYGEGNVVDRYELTDYDGNKILLDDLNGYQKGIVLNDCYAYFENELCFNGRNYEPCGVIEIKEEIV